MPSSDPGLPEVAALARDLIRFDTTNHGGGRAAGEREAAEYVGAYLETLGLEPEFYEPLPRRTNVMARVPGRNRDKPALVLVGIALMSTGAAVGLLSGAPPLKRALRQLAIGFGAAAVTYILGLLFGVSMG